MCHDAKTHRNIEITREEASRIVFRGVRYNGNSWGMR